MTLSDLYTAVCLLAGLGLIPVTVGWAIDRWPHWKARHADFVLDAAQWHWELRQRAMWNAHTGHGGTAFAPWLDPSPHPR